MQAYATPSIVHDVAPLNDEEATKLVEVNICNLEPALVVKDGVTVKEI